MKKVIFNMLMIVSLIFSMNVCCSAETLEFSVNESQKTINRVPPLPDRILFREIYVWPRYTNDITGEEFIPREISASLLKYTSSSAYEVLYVRPEKKAELDSQTFAGYTQVGYHVKIVYEIQGDEQFNLRKIVTQEPANVAPITFLPNGKHTFEGNTTMESPSFSWRGLFYRKTYYSSTFSAAVNFRDQ